MHRARCLAVRPTAPLLVVPRRFAHTPHTPGEGTGWPKPSSRQPLTPYYRDAVEERLRKTPPASEKIRERIMSLEGWLFGKKVIYLNREQPYYEQVADNSQYLFGERPPPPGYKRLMADWEILIYAGIAASLFMILVASWAKPETDPRVWAREEARERAILRKFEEERS